MSQKAWMTAYTKGSKSLQQRLAKIHANNPEFQDFVKKHGFGGNLSVKQSGLQKKSSIGVQQTEKNAPTKGPVDREAMIRAAAEKLRDRKLAAANRSAFGGELGGGWSMPSMGFRTYREDVDYKGGDKLRMRKGGWIVVRNGVQHGVIHPTEGHAKAFSDATRETLGRKIMKALRMKVKDVARKHYAESKENRERVMSYDSAVVTSKTKLPKLTVDPKSRLRKLFKRIGPLGIKKLMATENTEMSSEKTLNELRKATLASYLSKAGGRIRSGTKIGLDFEKDAYKDMAVANKHHPNMVTPGFEKDPAKLAKAEKSMKTNFDLANTFKRDAANRIKGIARAGRLLAKEEAEQIDELKRSTVASYLSKAINRHTTNMAQGAALAGAASVVAPGRSMSKGEFEDHLGKKAVRQMDTRPKGMNRALKQLAKEDTVNEAPLSPEHKAAIKTLKNIPSNYSHRDLQLLKKHTGAVADKASDAEYSARYEKQQRVQNKNKKRTVKETGSSIKNQEGHILHMKKRSVNSFDYTAHIGRGGPQVDAGSWSAIRYKHKIGGYNRHFNKAAFDKKFNTEEVEPVNEVSRSTIAKVAQARYNQAQKALKDKNYHEYTVKMKKAIKASDATTPKTGWSHEEETQLPAAEPIVEVSAQEKYRQIREGMFRMGTRMAVKDDDGNKIGHVQRDSSPGRWRGYNSKTKEYTYHSSKMKAMNAVKKGK